MANIIQLAKQLVDPRGSIHITLTDSFGNITHNKIYITDYIRTDYIKTNNDEHTATPYIEYSINIYCIDILIIIF